MSLLTVLFVFSQHVFLSFDEFFRLLWRRRRGCGALVLSQTDTVVAVETKTTDLSHLDGA